LVQSGLKDRVPPHNEEAEVATLGALLLDSEALATVIRYLRPEDFYKSAHQRIYQSILALFDRNEAIDLIPLTEPLREAGLLEACGGAAYVARLTSAVPTSANVRYYAQIVQEASIRRNLARIASEIIANSHNEGEDVRLIIEEAERQIFEITARPHTGTFPPAREVVPKPIVEIAGKPDTFLSDGKFFLFLTGG